MELGTKSHETKRNKSRQDLEQKQIGLAPSPIFFVLFCSKSYLICSVPRSINFVLSPICFVLFQVACFDLIFCSKLLFCFVPSSVLFQVPSILLSKSLLFCVVPSDLFWFWLCFLPSLISGCFVPSPISGCFIPSSINFVQFQVLFCFCSQSYFFFVFTNFFWSKSLF